MRPATPPSVRDHKVAVFADLLQEDPATLGLLLDRLAGSDERVVHVDGLLGHLRRHPAAALAVLEELRVAREWTPYGEASVRSPAVLLLSATAHIAGAEWMAHVYRLTDEPAWRVDVLGVHVGSCATAEEGREIADRRLLEQSVALLGGAS